MARSSLTKEIMALISALMTLVVGLVLIVVLLSFTRLMELFQSLSGNSQLLFSICCLGSAFVFAVIVAIVAVVFKLFK